MEQEPEGDEFYSANGELLISRLAESPVFLYGVDCLEQQTRAGQAVLMRRAEDPARCGKQIRVAQRLLMSRGISIHHIRRDGRLEQEPQRRSQKKSLSHNKEAGADETNTVLKHMKVFSIGFTHHTAESFFETLQRFRIACLLDIRLNNWSQFAGFTKKTDFPYLLQQICRAEYKHELMLAPTRELLTAYKKSDIGWPEYERRFLALMAERKVEKIFTPDIFALPTALLCYEPTAECCHRRLVLDYLQEKWGCLSIIHL